MRDSLSRSTSIAKPRFCQASSRVLAKSSWRSDVAVEPISACCSTGERFYAGEGLLGMARTFLPAGAQAVIAASWGATDASTQQLMDSFYDSLNQGTPDVALRKALSLCSIPTDHFARPIAGLPF